MSSSLYWILLEWAGILYTEAERGSPMCSTAVATMVRHGAQPTMAMMTFSRGHNGFSHRLPLFPLWLWLSPLTTALPDGGFFSSIATIRLLAVGTLAFVWWHQWSPRSLWRWFPSGCSSYQKNTKKRRWKKPCSHEKGRSVVLMFNFFIIIPLAHKFLR